MMQSERLDYLFRCYYDKNIAADEHEELMTLLLLEENQQRINFLIDSIIRDGQTEHHLAPQTAEDILSSIFSATDKEKDRIENMPFLDGGAVKTRPLWIRILVAASLGALLMYGGYRWQSDNKLPQEKEMSLQGTYGTDVAPGGNKASLTLSDGNTVDLAKLNNGNLPGQPETQIDNTKGEIKYSGNPERNDLKEMSYNTLTTPFGGQYKIVLPDGSRAWLNAGSSLRFPIAFIGSKRQVEMSGEVYFEIEPDKSKPFTVQLMDKNVKGKNMEITVLGTHFNVSSYGDEPVIQTTLLEGSVKIQKDRITKILSPGQQARIAAVNKGIEVKTVDTETVVAWKEGRFEFNGSIKDIMRQISRWYNLEIIYEGNVGSRSFAGAVSRTKNVSEVLKMLELTGGIRFEVGDGKITVKNSD